MLVTSLWGFSDWPMRRVFTWSIFSFVHLTKSIVNRVKHFGFRNEVQVKKLKRFEALGYYTDIFVIVLYCMLFHDSLCSWGYLMMMSSHAICSISSHCFFVMELYTGNFHLFGSCSIDLLRLITQPFSWPFSIPVSNRLVQELSGYPLSINTVPTFLCILQFCYVQWNIFNFVELHYCIDGLLNKYSVIAMYSYMYRGFFSSRLRSW